MKEHQCKHIPILPILIFLEREGGIGCTWEPGWNRSVANAMPEDTPYKLILAKMRQLVRTGLVNGCLCGCRGDWELTEKGKSFLKQEQT